MASALSRRAFLAAGAAAVVAPSVWQALRSQHSLPPGEMMGAAKSVGHLLRGDAHEWPAPASSEQVRVAIVGGGIAGLSAAWWLQKHGVSDFKLYELDHEVGGNSASGVNSVSRYPWGAHYVPIPGKESRYVRELFEEFGIITGHDGQGRPIYDELFLCHDPEERLLVDGHWQEGIRPRVDANPRDLADFTAFDAVVAGFRGRRGRDGRSLFAIPIENSSRDAEILALDRLSMRDFLNQKSLHSERLHWFVNYCCRDDFGTPHAEVSAWAGLHYFAARGGDAANADSHAVLTWPEGNGWLVEKLRAQSAAKIETDALAISIRHCDRGAEITLLDPRTRLTKLVVAEQVICAVPRFVAAHLIEEWRAEKPAYLKAFEYAPWMVANITIEGLPWSPAREFPLAWDNVSYSSDSLGYVVATHQNISRYQNATVLTLYWPLSEKSGQEARRDAEAKSLYDWKQIVLAELDRYHPGIHTQVRNIDIWLWGHGMIRPTPGFIWGEARRSALAPFQRVHFAHSDMSGISIFEEAQYRGVTAAEAVMTRFVHG